MTDKPTPKRPRAQKIDLIERIAKLVQNLTIIFGVFAGVFALLISQHDKRVQNVLTFRTEFTATVRPDYLTLISDWNSFPVTDKILTATQDEQKQIVSDFFAKEENEKHFLSVADFFNTLSACIEHGACDRNSVIYLFQDTATAVFEMAGYYIEAKRKEDQDPTFARGLENIYRLNSEFFLFSYV